MNFIETDLVVTTQQSRRTLEERTVLYQ